MILLVYLVDKCVCIKLLITDLELCSCSSLIRFKGSTISRPSDPGRNVQRIWTYLLKNLV